MKKQIGVYFRFGLIFLSVMLLCSCSAGSKITAERPIKIKLSNYKTVTLQVTSAEEDVEEELAELEENIINELTKLQLFESVSLGTSADSTQSDLHIKATVLNMKKVGGRTRFFLGAFAGRASVELALTLTEKKNNTLIGSYSIEGESGGTGFSGGTDDALDKAAEQIAQLVLENY